MAAKSLAQAFKESWSPWLWTFLGARGLIMYGRAKADGRALFRYRCTDEEFESLRVELDRALQGRLVHAPEGALLCLYVAERWRRAFGGGAWRWPELLRGSRALLLPDNDRNALVDKGLGLWGRNVHRNARGNDYIGTLAAEGGLPLQVLTGRDHSKVQTFLTTLVDELAGLASLRVKSIAADPRECLAYGRRQQRPLPNALREDTVLQLGAELAAGIILLDDEVRQGRGSLLRHRIPDMGEWFRGLARVPNWQDRLPLVVDEAGVVPLVQLLLNRSRTTRRRATAERERRLGWVWRLEPTASGWRRVRRFEGTRLSADQVANLCGQTPETRIRAFASVEAVPGSARLLGDFSQSADGSWHFEEQQPLPTDWWPASVDLEVVAAGLPRRPVVIAPSGLDGCLPWLFVEEEGALDLVGQGGCQTSADVAWLSVPSGMGVVGSGADASAEPATKVLGRPAPELAGRSWWWIGRGTVRVDNRWSITCRSSRRSSAAPEFEGELLEGVDDPWPLYRGFPHLQDDRWQVHIQIRDQWRPLDAHDRVGVFQTRLSGPNDEEVPGPRLHVAPRDLVIHASPAGMVVASRELDAVEGRLEEPGSQLTAFAETGGCFSAHLPVPDAGGVFRLQLRTRAGEELTIRWPVLTRRPILLDRAGQRMADRAVESGERIEPAVPLGGLWGHRLRTRLEAGQSLYVRLFASGEEWWVKSDPASADGLVELGLDRLEVPALRLLAIAAEKATGVMAEAFVDGEPESRTFRLLPVVHDVRLEGDEVVGPPAAKVTAWPVKRPWEEPEPLERVDDLGTRWRVPASLADDTTWVVRAEDSAGGCSAAPLIWPDGEGIDKVREIRERFRELTGPFDAGVGGELDYLEALIRKLDQLPVGSLGAGRMLVEFPAVALGILFSAGQDGERIRDTLVREGLELRLLGMSDLGKGIELAWRRVHAIPWPKSLIVDHGINPFAQAIQREQAAIPALVHAVRIWRERGLRRPEAKAWAEALPEPPSLVPRDEAQHHLAMTDLEADGWTEEDKADMARRAEPLLKSAKVSITPGGRGLRRVAEWVARVLASPNPPLTPWERLRLMAFRDQKPGWFDLQLQLALSLNELSNSGGSA